MAAIAAWMIFHALGSPLTGIDDANIFMVYARHLSAGEGFVFNPGGERVEGFSSMAWVLVCAAGVGLSSRPELLLFCVNVVLLAITLYACLSSSVLAARQQQEDGRALTVGMFLGLLLSDSSFVAWNTVTLMETGLWTAVLTVTSMLAVDGLETTQRRAAFAVLLGAIVLTRPEGLLWGPVLLGTALLHRPLATVVPAAATYLMTAAGLTLFRIAYFGYPLPNTYYAKVSPSLGYTLEQGVRYLTSYATSSPVAAAAVVLIVLSAAHLIRVRGRDEKTLALCTLSAAGLGIPVMSGGDHFEGFRFYQPIAPLLLLHAFHAVRTVLPAYAPPLPAAFRPAAAAAGVLAVAGAAAALWTTRDVKALLDMEFTVADAGRRQGTTMNRIFEGVHPLPAVGTITTGGIQNRYDGPIVDLVGLNNTRMAHNGGSREGYRSHAAFEKATFFELQPDAVLPLVQYGSIDWLVRRSHFVDQVLKGLIDEPRFRQTYMLAELRRLTPEGTIVAAAWYKRDLLSRLAQSSQIEVHMPVPSPGDRRAIILVRMQPSPPSS